jgi:para-nitrobenzyl esterase
MLKPISFALALLGAGVATSCTTDTAAPAAPATIVATDAGKIEGVASDGVIAWKGVPFAAPPVGELRWRPPQKPAHWSNVRAANDFGDDCLQGVVPNDPGVGLRLGEDCLYLNVWRPAAASAKKLPVMVWIYGGGLVNGGTQPAIYQGDQFARKGVVFVSVNYRLGRFGFFAHPALTKERPGELKSNYGYMDQIAALQWVQANIASFGGDPGNVTVFGESAGGYSVHTLLASPLAKGLFHKAIVESGGGRDQIGGERFMSKDAPGRPSGEATGVAFAQQLGVTDTGPAGLAALRAMPADKIVDNLSMRTFMSLNPVTYSGPVTDGKLILETPEAAFKAGRQMKIPIIVGANSADLGRNASQSLDELYAPFTDKAAAKAAYDPSGSNDLARVRAKLGMDQAMVEPARFVAASFAAQGLPAYQFRFDYVADALRTPQTTGAPHASEIPFVFDKVIPEYLAMRSNGRASQPTVADKAMAVTINAYWLNFAKTGDPNGPGLPAWPKYDRKGDAIMLFHGDGVVAAGPDPWKARLDQAESLRK